MIALIYCGMMFIRKYNNENCLKVNKKKIIFRKKKKKRIYTGIPVNGTSKKRNLVNELK